MSNQRYTIHIDVPDELEFNLDADTVYSMLWNELGVSDGDCTVEVVYPHEQEVSGE